MPRRPKTPAAADSPDAASGAADTRPAAIAAATRALIVERGFAGLRTRDIADRVGINIATLHYHVPGKARLVELVAESLRDDFLAQQARRPRAGLTPPERLDLGDFCETFTGDPDRREVMAELVQRARHDASVRAVLKPMQEGWLCHVAAIIADGVADGSFRSDADPQAGARMIVATLMGFRRLPDAGAEMFDALARELLRGLAPQATTPPHS